MAPSVDRNAPRYIAFQNAFEEKYDTEPPLFSDFAYDAAQMILLAIQAKGYSGEKIREGLREVGAGYRGVTGIKTFDENGDVAGTYATFEIKGGRFVDYEAP
jgi:branched-chain amino acid transport system substrate-binding protein